MSIYRTLLAAVAAVAIASPVFADDAATTTTDQSTTTTVQSTDGTTTQTDQQTTTTTSTKVNLNTASTKDLLKIKGINASKARAIVAYRKKHGDFKSVEDLSKVKGFTKLKATSIKDIEGQVTVE